MSKHCRVRRMSLASIVAVILVVISSFGVLAPVAALGQDDTAIELQDYRGFADINPEDWYVTSGMLDYVVDNGLITGYSDGVFGPNDYISRGQIATILHRIVGSPNELAEPFDDVDYSQYYGEAITWARARGVVNGYGHTNNFGPDNPITREELACILANFTREIANQEVSSDCARLAAIEGANEVSSWARVSLGWAVDNGILSGIVKEDGVAWVEPQDTALRCQAAKMVTVLHRDIVDIDLTEPTDVEPNGPTVVEYADDVILAEGDVVQASTNGDSLTATLNAGEANFKVGDTLALPAGPGVPFGQIIKVTSVTDNGSTIIVGGILSNLGDSFEVININAHIGMSELQEAVQPILLQDVSATVTPQHTVELDFSVDVDKYGKVSGSLEVEDFDLYVKYTEKIFDRFVDIDFDADIKPSIKLEFDAVPDALGKLRVASIPIPMVSIFGCGLYVNVYVTVDVTGSVEVSTSLNVTAEIDKPLGGDFDFDADANSTGDASLTAAIEGRVGMSPTIALQAIKPLVDFGTEAGVAGVYEITVHPGLACQDLLAWIYAEGFAELGGEWTDNLKFTIEILNKDNSITTGAHFENGHMVPDCTYDEHAEEPDEPSVPDEPDDPVIPDSPGQPEEPDDPVGPGEDDPSGTPGDIAGTPWEDYLRRDGSRVTAPTGLDAKYDSFQSMSFYVYESDDDYYIQFGVGNEQGLTSYLFKNNLIENPSQMTYTFSTMFASELDATYSLTYMFYDGYVVIDARAVGSHGGDAPDRFSATFYANQY